MTKKSISFIIIVCTMSPFISFTKGQSLENLENNLNNLFTELRLQKEDKNIDSVNTLILKTFRKTLATENSFNYNFEKLNKISKQISKDKKLKIYNWNLQYKDGSFKYFGFFHYKQKRNTYKIIELFDNSEEIKNPENLSLTNKNWYGALYYKIITKKYKGAKYYTLLGWDGNNLLTNKKLIETLTFTKNGNATFGIPILKFNNRTQKRIFFEFGEQVSMVLRYDEKFKMIVWDRLTPSKKELVGKPQYYGPSFVYDGLGFKKGYWLFYKDIQVKNTTAPDKKEHKYGY